MHICHFFSHITVLTYHVTNTFANPHLIALVPLYISDLLTDCGSAGDLRSSVSHFLAVPKVSSKCVWRSNLYKHKNECICHCFNHFSTDYKGNLVGN